MASTGWLYHFLVPLLAGFIFVSATPYFDYKALRHGGHRLVFYVAVCGYFLLVAAHFLAPLILPAYHWLRGLGGPGPELIVGLWHSVRLTTANPEGVSRVAPGLAVFLASFYWLIAKLACAWLPIKQRALATVLKEDAGPIERTLARAYDDDSPVMITLKSRKIYVGIILEPYNPTPEWRAVRVAPLWSGYRDKDTMQVHKVTDYEPVVELLQQLRKLKLQNSSLERVTIDVSGRPELTLDGHRLFPMIEQYGIAISCSEIESVTIYQTDLFNWLQLGAVSEDSSDGADPVLEGEQG